MNISQRIEGIGNNNYDDEIVITDVPQGWFPAVTGLTLQDGSATREVRVDLLELEQSMGETMNANTGIYVKNENETAVKVSVFQNGTEVASNTQSYS